MIGQKIKEIRERLGKSARQVSIEANLGAGFVSHLESHPETSPRLDALIAIADALGVSVSYLIDEDEAPRSNQFADSEAEPWSAREPLGERPDQWPHLRKLPETLAPSARSVATYRILENLHGFGLLPDDVIVVDTKTPAQSGDIVVAKMVDLVSGAGTLVVRRFLAPYLISNDAVTDRDMLVVDNVRTTITGRVTASFRAPGLV